MANSSHFTTAKLNDMRDVYSLLNEFYTNIISKEEANKEAIAILEEIQSQHYRATYKRGKFPFKVEHKLNDHAPTNHSIVVEVDTKHNNPYDCKLTISLNNASEQEIEHFNYSYNLIAANK